MRRWRARTDSCRSARRAQSLCHGGQLRGGPGNEDRGAPATASPSPARTCERTRTACVTDRSPESQTLDYAAGRGRPASKDLNYRMSVDDYFKLDGKEKEEVQNLRDRWEKSFEVFAKVRLTFEWMFKDGKVERPLSFAALIREHYIKKRRFCFP